MGVPKFYRFISDRYPCINKIVKEYEIPEYDNLYLDMNSMIHSCAHPSDSDVHFRIGKKEFSDEDIYQNVCRYIEIIFSIVKPIDLMYLAFDGVAPRAKMNQQRGHRFRYAKVVNEALIKNQVIPEDTLFDANCITTGTVFMDELICHVRHFVAYKISTDSAWQKCKIFVSGPEVPGEGEHKIMEFIRYNKAQPNYNQNTRHCLHSIDADLIILGLCTHEPHFSLLREKVTFGKRMDMITPEESDFDLLHLSLLRQYLEYEFAPIKSKLTFSFDLEKIIDDYVLIGFLVGNDFIPQLPNLNIVDGALPLLYQVYRKVLPTLDGYINECGELNVKRLKIYISMLSESYTNLSKPCKIPEFLANELESENNNFNSASQTVEKDVSNAIKSAEGEDLENRKIPSKAEPRSEDNNSNDDSQIKVNDISNTMKLVADDDIKSRRILIENAFKELDLDYNFSEVEHLEKNEEISIMTKNISNKKEENVLFENPIFNLCMEEYYKEKFKIHQVDKTEILVLVQQYVKAIQWTLKYYYQGCCSWSWYYPYHYAPLTTDFHLLQSVTFDFIMDTPFLPLQHLLAVLPPANVHLLPKPLQFLLINEKSPIIDFYPKDFEIDLNGKTNDWESIVLIPFIDENRLKKAMEPYMKNLSFKEQKRNFSGQTYTFTYVKNSLGQYPVETIFGSFENHAHILLKNTYLSKDKLISGLCSEVSFDLSFPGFPTLKHIPHSVTLSQEQSKFNTHKPIKIERMILRVLPKKEPALEDLAKEFLGQNVYVCWPYIKEAHIIGVTDFKRKIMLINFWKEYTEDNVKNDELVQSAVTQLHQETKLITDGYKNLFGIEIGKTNILFYLFPLMGKKYTYMNNGKIQLQTKWSQLSKLFPSHLIVKEKIKRHNFTLYKSVDDLFFNGSACFMISQPNYGAKGEIKGIGSQHLVHIVLESSSQPNFSSCNGKFFVANNTYVTCNEVSKKLKINSILISRITGSLIVTEVHDNSKYHDIGLRIKYPKHNKELFNYTKKDNNGWLYSDKAIKLIESYINTFPYIFENLNKNMKLISFTVSDLFPNGLTQLHSLKVWLSEQKIHYTTFLECHTKTLGLNGVPELEKHIADFYSKEDKHVVSMQVKAQSLFVPGTITGLVPPDFKAEHKLLDRIICVKNNFTVPFGLRGTIIGIQEKPEKCKFVYEVLFDSPFTGGLTLYESSEHKCYRLMVTDFINISFGLRNSQNQISSNNPKKKIINNTKINKDNYNKFKKNPKKENKSSTVVKTDNKSNNSEQVPRKNFQRKNHNSFKKTDNTKTSKESEDCHSYKLSDSNSHIKTKNSRPDAETHLKSCNNNKSKISGNKIETGNSQPSNAGTRPKVPFHQKNRNKFQGKKVQKTCNINIPTKDTESKITKTEQGKLTNNLSNLDADQKSINSNEN